MHKFHMLISLKRKKQREFSCSKSTIKTFGAMCEICLKLTTKTPERRRSDVFIFNFEEISHTVLVFPLLVSVS